MKNIHLVVIASIFGLMSGASAKEIPKRKVPLAPTKSTPKSATPAKVDPQTIYANEVTYLMPLVIDQLAAVVDLKNDDSKSYQEKMDAVSKARKSITALQSISPVPKSLARADELLVRWMQSLNKCLDYLKGEIGTSISNSEKFENEWQTGKVYREAFIDEFERATKPGIKKKVLVPG